MQSAAVQVIKNTVLSIWSLSLLFESEPARERRIVEHRP